MVTELRRGGGEPPALKHRRMRRDATLVYATLLTEPTSPASFSQREKLTQVLLLKPAATGGVQSGTVAQNLIYICRTEELSMH